MAERFAADPGLDGLAGRPVAADGRTAGRWPSRTQRIRPETVFHTAISHTIFLRLSVIGRVGGFDERLGLGSGTPWSSGEEIDFLARALHAGARIEYDPSLVVTHPVKTPSPDELVALGRRDGGSLGYILDGQPLSRGDDRAAARAAVHRGGRLRRSARRHPRPVPARDARRPSPRAGRGTRPPLTPTRRAPRRARRGGRASRRARSARPRARGRATARRSRSASTAETAAASASGGGRLVPLEPVGMRHADAGDVADELDGAAARRVRDGDAARHRLDHRGRAWVVHLRVEQDVGPAVDVGRLALRVPPRELHGRAEPEPGDRRVGVGDEPSADEKPRARVLVQHVPERLERELEAVLLRLVAAEQHDGTVRRAPAPGVKMSTSTAFGRISHGPSGTPRNASEERLLNRLW